MTKEGYHTILVLKEDYEKIKNIAKKLDKSIRATVSEILSHYIKEA